MYNISLVLNAMYLIGIMQVHPKICHMINQCNDIEKRHFMMTFILVYTPLQAVISSLICMDRAVIKRPMINTYTLIGCGKL